MILRARVVVPVSGNPIENGAVLISGNRISAVGRWCEFSRTAPDPIDLGDSILLPGLVNAHCHLDYTDMAGFLPPMSFPDWVKGMLAHKASWSYTEYAHSWVRGAQMLLRTGTTTVADIEAVPELLPETWSATPLRVGSFLEITCVRSRREPAEIVSEAAEAIQRLKPQRGFVGLSPHALYSTSPPLLELIGAQTRKENWRMTMHVAESPEEYEMYSEREGGMFHWLKKQRDMSDCGHGTPVAQLQRCGLLCENMLAVHANYLAGSDVKLLADGRVSVAHCPRSHTYFGYDAFPYTKLSAAGVNVCLGTDSLASVNRIFGNKPELSLFAEMNLFAAKNPEVAPATIMEMATLNGARALGMQGQIGEFSEGSLADLIAIPFSGTLPDVCATIVHNWQDVRAAMIDGQWAIPPK